jgi:hypothetical protein
VRAPCTPQLQWLVGNEEYNPSFIPQVSAIMERFDTIGVANPLYFMFPENGGMNSTDAARAVAAGLPIPRIMPDLHVGAGGAVAGAISDFNAMPNFPQSAVNCETNAGTHTMIRAAQEAADLNVWFGTLPPAAGRLVARTASFCNERASNYDAFDQGLSFFTQNASWLQPPGFVHAMITATWADNAVDVQWLAGGGANAVITASAQVAANGTTAYVRLANPGAEASTVGLQLSGWKTVSPAVTSWTLANADANAANTLAQPSAVSPVVANLNLPCSPACNVTLPAYSFVIYAFAQS